MRSTTAAKLGFRFAGSTTVCFTGSVRIAGELGTDFPKGIIGGSERRSTLARYAIEFLAYCVRCKMKRVTEQIAVRTNPTGRKMQVGNCPVCGMELIRVAAKDDEVVDYD